MKNAIIRIILILVILGIVGLFAYDYFVNDVPVTEHLVRGGIIILICIVGLVRTFQIRQRRSLEFYAAEYSELLGDAFDTQPFWQKKLLCAIRLYNENNYDKALKYLFDLKDRAQTQKDHYIVFLFAALCFTDMGVYEQAIRIYQQLISKGNADSVIFSNLGHVQMKTGDHKNALRNYKLALEYDSANEYAYNNIAQAHFHLHEFDEAIPYAEKALEINPKLKQASSLLAIIYALENHKENAEKYFHIAISSGYTPGDLKETIEYFRTAQHALDEEETNG